MKKKKWLKRILIASIVLLLAGVGVVVGLNQLRHRRPDGIPPTPQTRPPSALRCRA